MRWPTMDEFAQRVAEKAIDEVEINGKTLREWIEIIAAAEHGTDAISRQAAIDAFYLYPNINWTTLDVLKKINEIPTIQPKRGHWIEADVCGDITSWECSCCHNWTGLPTGWNVKAKLWFCPKCTADMRSEQNG